jgi:hypothetical protein
MFCRLMRQGPSTLRRGSGSNPEGTRGVRLRRLRRIPEAFGSALEERSLARSGSTHPWECQLRA